MPGNLGRLTSDMKFPQNTMKPQPARYIIFGVTMDFTGTPLGNCLVRIFERESGLLRAEVVSDASGNYSVDVNGPDAVDNESLLPLTFQAVAYKAGSPDVSGVTVNTLVGQPA
jgi:hypothetical protein